MPGLNTSSMSGSTRKSVANSCCRRSQQTTCSSHDSDSMTVFWTAEQFQTTRQRHVPSVKRRFNKDGWMSLIVAVSLLSATLLPCTAQQQSSPSWANAPTFGRQQVTPTFAQAPAPASAPVSAPITVTAPVSAPISAPVQSTPVAAPASAPVPSPVSAPVRAPWQSSGTSTPTITETVDNTAITTNSPTIYTDTPTPQPTINLTTSEPTNALTFEPSPAPTSAAPTSEPTTVQTDQPTVTAGNPTMSPTEVPTPEPTRRRRDTPAPAFKADDSPPTRPPTAPPETVDLVFLLDSVSDLLSGDTSDFFEDQTAQFIENSILQQEDGVDSVSVVVNRVAQRLVTTSPSSSSTSSSGNQRQRLLSWIRNLQSDAATYPLQVITTTEVNYRLNKLGTTGDAASLVGQAFNSPDKRSAYVESLQASGDPYFSTVNGVGVKVDGATPPEVSIIDDGEDVSSQDGNNQLTGIIIGSAIGGVAVLALGFFAYRKMGADDDDDRDNFNARKGDSTGRQNSQSLAFQTEIVVDDYRRDDDISTLGDPTMWGMAVSDGPGRDERTASLGDYDYAKQFLRTESNDTGDNAHSVSESNPVSRVSSSQSGYSAKIGLPPMNASVFSDDASFEQQFVEEDATEEKFEIRVPPGKLGMVIDTPNGDVPIVHAIKSESILYDRVKVGDRLVSVNGIDVSSMTALQVSKLISLKADQHRVLNFLRSGVPRER